MSKNNINGKFHWIITDMEGNAYAKGKIKASERDKAIAKLIGPAMEAQIEPIDQHRIEYAKERVEIQKGLRRHKWRRSMGLPYASFEV